MEYFTQFGYAGMFVSAFLAATIFPLSSEIVLSALLLQGLSPFCLVSLATLGNVLGSLTNYALGYWLGVALTQHQTVKKWLGISDQALNNARLRFKKYGLAILCFAWVPAIGDPLTVIAGVMRIRLVWFMLLVTLGKLVRYLVVTYLVLI